MKRESASSNRTDHEPRPAVRVDVWLDVACLFRTRSEAQRACRGGKVNINGHAARPNREVRPDDELTITRPGGRRQRVVVRGVADQHVSKAEARQLYTDTTPPPSPEEQALLDLIRLARRPPRRDLGAPDRRERRRLREEKETGSS